MVGTTIEEDTTKYRSASHWHRQQEECITGEKFRRYEEVRSSIVSLARLYEIVGVCGIPRYYELN
jgi:hypothetical protein